MFRFIKQVFIVLMLCFGKSLMTKCVSLNNQPFIPRLVLIDLNPHDLHYYSFMISLDKCDEIFNTVEDSFDILCVPN